MTSPLHAILVAHADGPGRAAQHLTRTLAALGDQRTRLNGLTVVIAGDDDRLRALAVQAGATDILRVPAGTGFAAAVAAGHARVPEGRHVWLLAQDTAPQPGALAALVGVLELAPSVAFAAPKLVDWTDASRIESLGVTMTRGGRSIELAEDQFDQGQLDGDEDVLGADVRGILIRDVHRAALLPDRALAGADEGLDLGVRARLAGHRVVLAPAARIAVANDGVAGLPKPSSRGGERRVAYSGRLAQLHRRLAYAAWPSFIVHWLSLLPLALVRTIAHLVAKAPARVLPEWGASVVAAFRFGAIARSRRQLRGLRGGWSQIAELRISAAEVRARRHESEDAQIGERRVRGDLRFFSGGGAWVVLAAAVVAVVANPGLLVWSAVGGGALLPLGDGLAAIWGEAAWGQRGLGLDEVGAADPFAAVLAVIGSFSPGHPTGALVVLWLIALPLAALGGWFAATRITDRSGLRMGAAVLWALAPTFLASLVQPRPAAVLAHLALPWLFVAVTVLHRSWGAAGAASLLLLVVAACSPSVGALLVLAAIVAAVVAAIAGAVKVLPRILWVVVPTVAAFAPLVWAQLRHGSPLAVIADPGRPYSGTQTGTSILDRLQIAAGFPLADAGGWHAFLAGVGLDGVAGWVLLVTVPISVLALLAPLTRRLRVAVPLVLVGSAAVVLAIVVSGLQVTFQDGTPIAVWSGSALSLAWLAITAGALVTLDSFPWRKTVRTAVAVAAVGLVAVAAAPALTASLRGESQLTAGQESTLPAFVTAEGRGDASVGTLILTPRADGGMATRVVWGSSETLGGQSTLSATRQTPTVPDERLAAAVADLITPSAVAVDGELAALGVRFVLLALPESLPESEPARALRLQTSAALESRGALAGVGETGKGELWRVVGEPTPRQEPGQPQQASAGIVIALQLGALLIAVLLAVPTFASRRAERQRSRIVGLRREESA